MDQLREATLEEKTKWIEAVSRGYTRGVFHNIPLEDLPLFFNGYDFYIVGTTPIKREDQKELNFGGLGIQEC